MESQEIIEFQNQRFFSHPIYNCYAASKDGKILGKKRKKILKPIFCPNGYLYFNLYVSNTHKFYLFSRFVYECFKGDISNDKEVDHIDNDKKK